MVGAMGLSHTNQLRPWHLMKRTGLADIRHYGELYEFLEEGALLGGKVPESFARPLAAAQAESFSSGARR